MWSIPWGIIEGRADWIGATVHLMDGGIDTGGVLWRGSPQLAPGDTSVDLLFRAHLQAAAALAVLLERYDRGEPPSPLRRSPDERSTYRSAAGLGDWFRFLRLEKGRRARVLFERGLRC
jgi:methionyl-tRNA formyltransferase